MKYSYALKISILEYARDHGTIAAARHFGIPSSTVVRWNRKYKIYETQVMRTFSVEQKIEMLRYANEHGLTNAMNHYCVDTATLQNWNKKLKIYQKHGSRHSDTINKLPLRISDAEKRVILEYARDHGPTAAARVFNIAASTIRLWNQELNVYAPRKHRKFTDEQKSEIIAMAEQFGIPHAAREFGVAGSQISDWITKQNQK